MPRGEPGSQGRTRGRIFYGWYVVAAAFAVCFIGFGSAYSFTTFLVPLQQEFAASRGSVSLVFSLAGCLYFALGIVSGPLADRWGARPLAIVGMALCGSGLALAGFARTLTDVYLAYGLGVGLGVGCAYVPVLGAVQRWFSKRRGYASGLAVSGIGVGTLVMPPIAAVAIDHVGWRGTYLGLGVFAAVAGIGMALLLDDDPSRRGLAPDGGPISATVPKTAMPGASVGEAIRSRTFAVLYLASMMSSFGIFVPFVHIVPYAVDHGVEKNLAVLLLGAIGVGSTAGRFVLGGIADRMGRSRALLAGFGCMGATLLGWYFATSLWALALFALAYGVSYGGWVAVMPAVVMDHFGGRSVSGILGTLYTSVALGTLIGPTAAGYAFDASGSYAVPILLAAAGNFIAAAIVGAMLCKPSR